MNRYAIIAEITQQVIYYIDARSEGEAQDKLYEPIDGICYSPNDYLDEEMEIKSIELCHSNIKKDQQGRIIESDQLIKDKEVNENYK